MIFVANLLIVLGLLTALWAWSVKLKDASIVDPFWGFGFVVVAWSTSLLANGSTTNARSWLLIGLTTIWGLRLSGYLLWRNMGKGEDRRYTAMREARGEKFWYQSLWIVFWLQAVLLWLISFPVQATLLFSADSSSLGLIDIVGVGLWCVGFFFEAVGDWQLARFKSNPANKGQVFDRGLWRYTRHPNYFGDFCIWWGLWLLAVAGGHGWTIFGPAIMSFFLMRVSGVTMLESTIVERRPGYREYIEKTNAFFPWLPKS